MTTDPKAARFRGGEASKSLIKDYSNELKKDLRKFYADNGLSEKDFFHVSAEAASVDNSDEFVKWSDEKMECSEDFFQAFVEATGGDNADEFVNKILAATNRTASSIHHLREEVNNMVLKDEYDELLKILKDAQAKLRKISPQLDRLISANAEPDRVADQIQQMVDYLKLAEPNLPKMTKISERAKRLEEKKKPIAVEMVSQVFAVLNEYGFDPMEESNKKKAIKLLSMIGREIGEKVNGENYRLNWSNQSWGARVKEAFPFCKG